MAEENDAVKYACIALGWPHTKGEIADILFSRSMHSKNVKKCAIDLGSFELKNKNLSPSPIYINLRTSNHPVTPGPLTREDVHKLAAEIRVQLFFSGITFDYVAGVPYGGEPIAKAFLDSLPDGRTREARFDKIGQESDRRVANFKVVEPRCQSVIRKRVLLVDDVLSSGTSLFEAIEAVEEAGYEVAGIIVVVDREQGGYEALMKRGYTSIVSVFRISELLTFGVLTSKLYARNFVDVMAYLERTRDILINEQ